MGQVIEQARLNRREQRLVAEILDKVLYDNNFPLRQETKIVHGFESYLAQHQESTGGFKSIFREFFEKNV